MKLKKSKYQSKGSQTLSQFKKLLKNYHFNVARLNLTFKSMIKKLYPDHESQTAEKKTFL